MWALFGYKEGDLYEDFLAEKNTKEELKVVEVWAIEHGYIKFNYSRADGTLPDFTKAITI